MLWAAHLRPHLLLEEWEPDKGRMQNLATMETIIDFYPSHKDMKAQAVNHIPTPDGFWA